MMSSIDRAAPLMYNSPWMRAMVGLMPHSDAMLFHRSTN